MRSIMKLLATFLITLPLFAQGVGVNAVNVSTAQKGTGAVLRTQQSKNAELVSVKDFGAVCDGTDSSGTDNQAAVLAAIAAVASRGTVVFPSSGCSGGYVVSTLGTLSKLVTLDLDGSYVYPKTNAAVWLEIPSISPAGTVVLRNGVIQTYTGYIPTDVISLSGQHNVKLENMVFQSNTVSHSVFWNKAAYGSVCSHCTFNSNNAPYSVYYSHHVSDPAHYFTLASKIRDSDFSGVATGVCIGIEGGELTISDSVIESCAGGGIQHLSESKAIGNAANLNSLQIVGVHFEGNSKFNLAFPPTAGPHYFQSVVTITGSTFTVNPGSSAVQLGGNTHLSMIGNWVQSGCITGSPTDLHGTVYVENNEIGGPDTNGVCDVNTAYTFARQLSGRIKWNGTLQSQLYGPAGVGTPRGETSDLPTVFTQVSPVAGAKAVSIRDSTLRENAYITKEGNFLGNTFTGNSWSSTTGTVTISTGVVLQLGTAGFQALTTHSSPNGMVYCVDCDAPSTEGAACSSAGSKTGAEAHYVRGGWICF